ncbi:hypothetical protein ACW95P_01505 [Candidatus Mycoplasma pogonae]
MKLKLKYFFYSLISLIPFSIVACSQTSDLISENVAIKQSPFDLNGYTINKVEETKVKFDFSLIVKTSNDPWNLILLDNLKDKEFFLEFLEMDLNAPEDTNWENAIQKQNIQTQKFKITSENISGNNSKFILLKNLEFPIKPNKKYQILYLISLKNNEKYIYPLYPIKNLNDNNSPKKPYIFLTTDNLSFKNLKTQINNLVSKKQQLNFEIEVTKNNSDTLKKQPNESEEIKNYLYLKIKKTNKKTQEKTISYYQSSNYFSSNFEMENYNWVFTFRFDALTFKENQNIKKLTENNFEIGDEIIEISEENILVKYGNKSYFKSINN